MYNAEYDVLIPTHVAFACDGNGRWAQERGLDRVEGHKAGAENFQRVAEILIKFNVQITTVWAMSNENWGRPVKEVQGILGILRDALNRDSTELSRKGVRLGHIGNLSRLSPQLRNKILSVMNSTASNSKLLMNIAFDYGGKQDIVQAVKKMLLDKIPPETLSEDVLSRYLYTKDLPNPDLLIRTGGDRRMSNYLIWQTVDKPFFITPVYWPDFGESDFIEALQFYTRIMREKNSEGSIVNNK